VAATGDRSRMGAKKLLDKVRTRALSFSPTWKVLPKRKLTSSEHRLETCELDSERRWLEARPDCLQLSLAFYCATG